MGCELYYYDPTTKSTLHSSHRNRALRRCFLSCLSSIMRFLRRLCPCFHKAGAASDDDGDDDHNVTGDSLDLIFELHTLQLATNFFSDLNQLGHGGFGPVFKVYIPTCPSSFSKPNYYFISNMLVT